MQAPPGIPPPSGTVLVTGGAGLIGANLVRALVAARADVLVLDDLSSGRAEYLDGVRAEVIKGSVTNARAVRAAAQGSNSIVHLAALSGVAPSVARPQRDFSVNVRGTFNVLEAARLESVERVVFASSGAVFAGARPPHAEHLVPAPLAPYGASKLYGEALLRSFESAFGITAVSLRLSNVYGPCCLHKRSVVAEFLMRALAGKPLVMYGTGRQTRDFMHVDDVVDAIQRSLTVPAGGTFQLGTGVETSIARLVSLVREAVGVPLRVERRPGRTGDASRSYADPALARSILRWDPAVRLKEGLASTLEWLSEHGGSPRPAGA